MVAIFFEPSSSSYLYPLFYKKIFPLIFSIMKPTTIQNPFASKGEFPEPPPKPKFSFGYELHPGVITMVRALPFARHDDENPCQHLLDFEEMCSCLSISGMTQETLRWKLFSLSLMGRAKQWYTDTVESTNGDWDEFNDKFCLAFFPMSHIGSLPRAIFNFEQREGVYRCSLGLVFSVNTCRLRLVIT
jgi:hypothetical protein